MNRRATGERWTPSEDAWICQLRRQGAGRDAIAKACPTRSAHAVFYRIGVLLREGRFARARVDRPKTRWTPEEDALIVRLRNEDARIAEIGEHFPHRTRRALELRIERFVAVGLIARRGTDAHKAWTRSECRTLQQMCGQRKSSQEMARELGRSVGAMKQRIRRMIQKGELPNSRRSWSAHEDALIVQLLRRKATLPAIARRLRHRTPRAVRARVQSLRRQKRASASGRSITANGRLRK